MQVRLLEIANFRGVRSLKWAPHSALMCLIGPGDSGKSTILDAIEATLSSKWQSFTDSDFTDCDPSKPIEIRVTVGELPAKALRDDHMGMHLRGWTSSGELLDEPQEDDESVVTVRLTVNNTLEPEWHLVTDRGDARLLSSRERALFCVFRLSDDVDRHLTFAAGSALARMNKGDTDASQAILVEALRKARALIAEGELPELSSAAESAYNAAKELGAYTSATPFTARLDNLRGSVAFGNLSLHDDGVPLRLAGLGTRRLVSLALQRSAIPEGAIVLIDEIEHGLEPHRLRFAIKHLIDSIATSFGQVFFTTHSPGCVVEVSSAHLAIVRREMAGQRVRAVGPELQALVRSVPDAFLSRRIIVCEGKTEVGFLRAMRSQWEQHHGGIPIEHRGICIADGNGDEAPRRALELSRLGFDVLLFIDSDVELDEATKTSLVDASIALVQWDEKVATEERVFSDVSDEGVQRLFDLACENHGQESVLDVMKRALGAKAPLPTIVLEWRIDHTTSDDHRRALARSAKAKKWFKRIDYGEELGDVVVMDIVAGHEPRLLKQLVEIESWSYG